MPLYLFCIVLAVLAVDFVTLDCHNGALKRRLHLCQVHVTGTLPHCKGDVCDSVLVCIFTGSFSKIFHCSESYMARSPLVHF